MKFNKSMLFVIFLIIIIIPFLTRGYLGRSVESFESSGPMDTIQDSNSNCLSNDLKIRSCTGKKDQLWKMPKVGDQGNIQVGSDPTNCLFKESTVHSGLVGNRLTIAKCTGGTGEYDSDARNALWQHSKLMNDGMSKIQVGTDPRYCVFKDSSGSGITTGKCTGGDEELWKINPILGAAPSAPTLASAPPPKLASCSSLSAFGEEDGTDGTDAFSILNNIKYFQQEELSILNKLKTLANEVSPNQALIDKYTTAIIPFQQSRIRLMKQLNNVSSQTQCSLATDRRALQDQVSLLSVVEDQLIAAEKYTNSVLAQKTGKKRMVEITNYENLRYTSHKNIFKTIAFCSLFVLAGIYLEKGGGYYGSWLGYPIIVLSIAVAAFLTVKKMWWNAYRNPRNWNQFMWEPPTKNKPTVWEYNMNSYNKGMGEIDDGINSAENTASSALNRGMKDVKGLGGAAMTSIKGVTNKTESFALYN